MRFLAISVASITAALLAALLLGPANAVARPDDHRTPSRLGGEACEAWEVDYDLISGTRFKITDTLMKAGDGVYDVGPGKLRVRFQDKNGEPGPGTAELLKLEVTTLFTVESKVAGIKTTVKTDAVSRNTPDHCGVVARGVLVGNKLTWKDAAKGYRSDGKLFCSGMMCGKMGAPPAGESPLQMGPYPVTYAPFVFGGGVKKVMMPFALVAKSDKPKQTTYLQIVGVETRRSCTKRSSCR